MLWVIVWLVKLVR